MLGDERLQPGKAKHITCRVVRLYQPITVEEGRFAGVQDGLLLLIAHRRHQAQGHPPRCQLAFLQSVVTMHDATWRDPAHRWGHSGKGALSIGPVLLSFRINHPGGHEFSTCRKDRRRAGFITDSSPYPCMRRPRDWGLDSLEPSSL